MKLYRINIKNMEDPLQNRRLLEQVSMERRKKVLRYRMPDDRKRSLGAGIIIKTILEENGLSESEIRYSENEKPAADGVYFNVSHAGDYVVGVSGSCEVGCDIEKIRKAPFEVASRHFCTAESEYINSAQDKDKAFFTLWTLKESYLKMTGRGLSLPLDSFEVVPAEKGFVLEDASVQCGYFQTMEFNGHIFSICKETDSAFEHMKFQDIRNLF